MKVICLFNIEKTFCININDYILFAEEIFNSINLSISNFGLNYINGKKNVNKDLVYKDKNLQKYSDININDTKMIMFLNQKKEGLPPYNIRCEITIINMENTFKISITYENCLKTNNSLIQEYEKINLIARKYFEYNMSFMDEMIADKQPELFIKGILSEPLNKYEEEVAYSISYNLGVEHKKMPFLFKVNSIKIKEDLFNEINEKFKSKKIKYDGNLLTLSFEDFLSNDIREYSKCSCWNDIFELLKAYNYMNFVRGVIL